MTIMPELRPVAAKRAEPRAQSAGRSRLKTILACLAAWAMLLGPALLNGGPFLMQDSTTYIRGADAVAYSLTGHRTAWTGELFKKLAPPGQEAAAPARTGTAGAKENAGAHHRPIILAGRSVYYGALLYLSYLAGSLWLAVAVQAMLAVACIALTLDALQRLRGRRSTNLQLLLLAGFLALLTPVGYFAGFLMPDITTPFAILATAHILLTWSSMNRPKRWFWVLLLVFSLASHSSNLLMVGLTAIALLLLTPIRRLGLPRWPAYCIALAVLAAAAFEAIFSFGVQSATGTSPVRPPFVTARLVEDGPGYRYLRDHCPGNGFVLCKYLDRLPQPSDNVLWEKRRGVGIFSALPPAEARAIALEQTRFILAVLADQPFEVAKSSLFAAARQASRIGLGEFNYHQGARRHFAEKLPGPVLDDVRQSAAFSRSMPVALVSTATIPVAVISLLVIVWAAFVRAGREPTTAAFALVVCLMLALNTALCGMLSTPHERYVMRAIWLLPLVAGCLLASLVQRSARPGAKDASQRIAHAAAQS